MSALTDQFATDLSSSFFNTNEFGESLSYYNGSTTTSIYGIFNDHTEIVDPSAVDGLTKAPVVIVRSADTPTARKGHRITRNAVVYYVQHAESDGMGATILILSKKENV
jgi:hypothetical protein